MERTTNRINLAVFIVSLLGCVKIFMLKEHLEPLYVYCILMGITGIRMCFSKGTK